MFYNRRGEPIDADEWMRLWEDYDYQVLAKTEVGGREVSTVWLGLDHSLGAKLIFETMVFPECALMWRYSTDEAAFAGHREMVELLREYEDLDPTLAHKIALARVRDDELTLAELAARVY